jgi:hypothetical protein
MPDPLEELLELYDLEELFEVLEIEPRRVIEILLEEGYVVLPDFLEREDHYVEELEA